MNFSEEIKEASQIENDQEIDRSTLLELYAKMVLIRKFETAVQENYRKGEIPGFIHLCIGEEAVAVGVCAALKRADWITSTHRGHGHGLAKGVDVNGMLAELYGKSTGTNGGRGGSMHIYSMEAGLLGTNGLVGGGIPLAVGLGMSEEIKGTGNIAVSFFGDGAICHGSFHESVSLAAIRKTPVLFVCENNLYATSTAVDKAHLNTNIASKAAAYGIPGIRVDGNDVVAVYKATLQAAARARRGEGPTLIEAITYRTVGHHEGDVLVGTYRTKEELEEWMEKCPIKRCRQQLLDNDTATAEVLDDIDNHIQQRIGDAVMFARSSPQPDPGTVSQHVWHHPVNPDVALQPAGGTGETTIQTWLAAVRDGIAEEMRLDPNILYMGEGIGERGGTFGHTKNLWSEFGERLIDTPICELGFTGAAAAASAAGCRTIADLMFADFIFDASTQIINQASKLRYMSNGQINVPVVIRAGAGQIKQAGPQHSGTFHSLWANIPGLIVVVPSTPADAKGLMKTALRASDPVIFLEPKSLFPTKGPVPVEPEYIPFGKARVVAEGDDITLISFGQPLHSCLEAAKLLTNNGISCEVIDLRTIVPLDTTTIIASVEKTKHAVVVDEGYGFSSIGAEIAALITEHCFYSIKAPVARLNKIAVPQPFSPALENEVTITPEKIAALVRSTVNGVHYTSSYLAVTGITNSASAAAHSQQAYENLVKEDIITGSTTTVLTENSIDIVIPNMGLTITEVVVAVWHKKPGDAVKKGETILEVESEKSIVELEAPADGTLATILADVGATVLIGKVVGTVEM